MSSININNEEFDDYISIGSTAARPSSRAAPSPASAGSSSQQQTFASTEQGSSKVSECITNEVRDTGIFSSSSQINNCAATHSLINRAIYKNPSAPQRGANRINPFINSSIIASEARSESYNNKVLHSGKKNISIRFENGDLYTGESLNGKPEGQGSLVRPNGDRYTGFFRDGMKRGYGKLTYASHGRYKKCEGFFDRGKLQGGATITYADGDEYRQYIGPLLNEEPHGNGKLTYANGNVYIGRLELGDPYGEGTLTEQNGRCAGIFIDGKLNGRGTYNWKNGSYYEGNFHDGAPSGQGKLVHPDGETYEGDLKQGRPHGKGKFTYPNGDIYEGEVHEGRRQGKGKLIRKNGDRLEGVFQNGELHGDAVIIYADGGRYKGPVKNGLEHGIGTFDDGLGNQYQGDFCNGLRSGKGAVSFATGEWYKGDFAAGNPQGTGTFFFPNRGVYTGQFLNGKPHGLGKFCFQNRDDLTIEGMWHKETLVADKTYLCHPAFLSCLLDKTFFPCKTATLSILSDYLRTKQGYSKIAEDLHSALDPGSVDQIHKKMSGNKNGEKILLQATTVDHAMLVELVSIDEYCFLKIFNSGLGLENMHPKGGPKDEHYETMVVFRIPKTSLTKKHLKKLIQPFSSIEEFIQFIYDLGQIVRIENPDPILQKPQKGFNCTLECVFAYLKNTLGDEAYHHMRMEFFDDCIKAIEAYQDKNSLPFVAKLKEKKKKRSNKYPNFAIANARPATHS